MNRADSAGRADWVRDQRASATLEAVVVVPVMVLMFLFVVAAGRVTDAHLAVNGAAADAVRAASMARRPAEAARDARAVATDSLSRRGVRCPSVQVTADVAELRPAGAVAVTVACRVDLSDTSPLGIGAARRVQGRARAPVDRYRSDP